MATCKVNSLLVFDERMAAPTNPTRPVEAFWVPHTDVYVAENGLVIKVELAGIRREQLELSAEGSRLTIQGMRPDGCRAPKCKFLVMEINYGAFQSVIEIPAGYDLGQARAVYQNGFLRIDVPKLSAPAPVPHPVPVLTEED